jgi:hypothetical protein
MSSTIRFKEASITLEEANLTLPSVERAFNNISIDAAKIDVRGSSTFQLTPLLIQIDNIDLTVSGNSRAILAPTDEVIFSKGCDADFSIIGLDDSDSSEILIDSLDFYNDDYTGLNISFRFITSSPGAPNLGKFTFPGNNGNAIACFALFSKCSVYVDDQRFTKPDFNIFNPEYSSTGLTLSLKQLTSTKN